MQNQTSELKVISSLHLKRLLVETGVGKKELADKIGRSAQAISALVNGKSLMSERTAKLINGIYPDYSVEWLTGRAEYPNAHAEAIAAINQAEHESALLEEGFRCLAELMGYAVTKDYSTLLENNGQSIPVEAALSAIGRGWLVCRDGKRAQLSIDEMSQLQNEIADFVDFKLGRLLKEQGNRS